jgi:hypothetical protein
MPGTSTQILNSTSSFLKNSFVLLLVEAVTCVVRCSTGADILLNFPLIVSKVRSPILTEQKFPLLWKYIAQLEQEPGYQKAVEKIVAMEGSFSATF